MKLSTPPKKKKSQQKKTHPNAVRYFRHFIFNTPKAGRPRRPCHSAPVQVLRGLSLVLGQCQSPFKSQQGPGLPMELLSRGVTLLHKGLLNGINIMHLKI